MMNPSERSPSSHTDLFRSADRSPANEPALEITLGDQSADLDVIATEFAELYRQGRRVSVESYASRYPELAVEIRELFPTIMTMERLTSKRVQESAVHSSRGTPPQQLGDFRVIGEIARGGMGIVYEAEQITLGRRVAVKVLPANVLGRERDVRRFEREAQTAAKLHHSNIVPVFGVGFDEGHHYIVMQLIRGVGLDEIITETKRLISGSSDHSLSGTARSATVQRSAVGLLEGELRRDTVVAQGSGETLVSGDRVGGEHTPSGDATPAPSAAQIRRMVGSDYYRNVARIGMQAAQALYYAHQHDTLHRDVKPGNLLLDQEGCVWIADFGLAKALENDTVTCSGDVVGTLAYVAPERFDGDATAQSDIYSLGLTLHEMLTFQRVFDGKDRVAIVNQVTRERISSPRQHNPAVPLDLETIVLKAASHDVSDRYQTAQELAEDLMAFLEERPIRARRLSRVEHLARWCRRNQTVTALACSVFFLAATVFGMTVAGYFHSQQQRRNAESTAGLAVGVLDELYKQFASNDLHLPAAGGSDSINDDLSFSSSQLPISKDVALLLENLLRFYDDLSRQTKDSDLVAVKSIAANRRVADIRRRLGQFDEAQAAYEEAIERIERLDGTLRQSEAVRIESARVRNGLGLTLHEAFDFRGSSKVLAEAIACLDHPHPTREERLELATTFYLMNSNSRRTKRGGDSLLSRAKAILIDLEREQPDTPEYRLLLARCLLADRNGCAQSGALSTCQAHAVEILESLVQRMPDQAEYRFVLGDAYRSIEWHEFAQHCQHAARTPEQLTESESRLRRALEVTADLEIQNPNIPQYLILKKVLHELLAQVLQEQNRIPAAAEELVRSIEKQQLIVKQADETNRHQYWLFELKLRYGQLLRDLGQPDQALLQLEPTVSGLELLSTTAEISNHDFYRHKVKETLARSYVTLANVLKQLGENQRSHDLLRKAEEGGA